jgi:hypothetical protein
MGLLIVGAVCGYVAFIVGKWRQLCVFFELNEAWSVPAGWRNPLIRYGTWMLVTVTSLLFATCLATLVMESVHPWLGRFLWGVLLMARWLASGRAAGKEGFRQLAALRSDDHVRS